MSVAGRVLPPPTVTYGNRSITPEKGAWNLTQVSMYDPKHLERWGLVVLMDERDAVQPRAGAECGTGQPRIHNGGCLLLYILL